MADNVRQTIERDGDELADLASLALGAGAFRGDYLDRHARSADADSMCGIPVRASLTATIAATAIFAAPLRQSQPTTLECPEHSQGF